MEERFARLEGDVGDIKRDMGKLQQDVGEVQQDVRKLQQDVGEVQQDVRKLQQDVGEVQHDVSALQKDVSIVQKDVSKLQQQVESHGELIHKLDVGVAVLTGEVSHVGQKVLQVQTDVHEVRTHQERDFRVLFGALIFVALGLSGLMAKTFGWIH